MDTKWLAAVQVNKVVEQELGWFVRHASSSSGTFLLQLVTWDLTVTSQEATICYVDACPTGMAYYCLELMLGYQCTIPMTHWGEIILHYEAAMFTASILHKFEEPQSQLVIYSDSQNSVNI